MSADIAQGHGGDGGGDDRPPLYQETQNLRLKAIMDKSGLVQIRFKVDDRETLMPLGDHAAHWANYLGELFRELPLHYPFWRQVPPKRKAGVVAKIRTSSNTCKRSTMVRILLSKKDIGFLKRTRLMTWSATDADVPRTFL
nr:hypothetical protein [Tanacetum cinerariifolium]